MANKALESFKEIYSQNRKDEVEKQKQREVIYCPNGLTQIHLTNSKFKTLKNEIFPIKKQRWWQQN